VKLPPLAALTSRLPRGNILWGVLCVLLALGALSSIMTLGGESARERARAIASSQRIQFDAKTAAQIGTGIKATAKPPKAEPSFDVADEEDAAANPATDEPTATGEEAPSTAEPAEEPQSDAESLNTKTPQPLQRVARSDESLVPAPAPEITEKTDLGALPKISGDNSPAKLYARRYQPKEGSMSLAIVVTGLGFSQDALGIALALPNDISLSFSPYAPELAQRIELMRDAGHEAWIDIPTQNPDYPATDPGPLGFIASLPERDMQERLLKLLVRSPGVVGGIFAPNETLSEFPSAMKPVLNAFAERGLMVLFTEPKRASSLPPIPSKLKARVADMWLASSPSRAMINSKFAGLLAATQADGTYMLAVEGTPQMLRLLKAWSEKIPAISPVKLVPLSALYVDHAAEAAKEAAEKAKAEAAKKKSGGH